MICWESNCNLVTRCNHYFHINCFKFWINYNKGCPICRSCMISVVQYINCMYCKDINFGNVDLIDERSHNC